MMTEDESSISWVLQKDRGVILKMSIFHMTGVYIFYLSMLYNQTKLYSYMSQLSITKESLKVIMNELD